MGVQTECCSQNAVLKMPRDKTGFPDPDIHPILWVHGHSFTEDPGNLDGLQWVFTQWKGHKEAQLTTGFINLWSDPLERTPEGSGGDRIRLWAQCLRAKHGFFRFFAIEVQIQFAAVGLPCVQNWQRRDCAASRLYRLPSP